jgi:type I restriction enzyme, R subunit
MSYGFASNLRDALPNASFIGFTGTPIEKTDANTRAVFGDYISIYDIQRAVADKATVPIYYESRISKLEPERRRAAEARRGVRGDHRRRGADEEGEAQDQVGRAGGAGGRSETHRAGGRRSGGAFREALEAMDGKAMIVCMSRRICVDLYNALIKLRPSGGQGRRAEKGCVVKVVMTGSADDGPEWQPHIRNKDKRRASWRTGSRTPRTPSKIVIVRDMWLTGFDAPCLHTMYADKPMQGHGLMQAIARVNRVFRDKPGGLVVDYLGLADQLKQALATYTESGGQVAPGEVVDLFAASGLKKPDVDPFSTTPFWQQCATCSTRIWP